jgi:NADPH:quinone reductase-like Zn-dependent oxidoreductase
VVNGGSGAFAEMALADGESIAHKPKKLSHPEAAALPTVGVSAPRSYWYFKRGKGSEFVMSLSL